MKRKILLAVILVACVLLALEVAFLIKMDRAGVSDPGKETQESHMTSDAETKQTDAQETTIKETEPPISLPTEDPEIYLGEEETFLEDETVTFPAETGATHSEDDNELPEEDF